MRSRRRLRVALGAGLLWAAGAAAQISPGPLARVHSAIDGSRDCLSCHASGQGVDPAKCLACHEILGQRIATRRGLHAQPGYEDCRLCHIDHHGRDYQLVYWGDAGMERFDHRLTGWALAGAHRGLGCRDCHKAELVRQPERLRDAGKDLERTLLGLPTACADCHGDEHDGQFGAKECAGCHTTAAWQPASGFDHATARFALSGRHAEVACSECHREEPAADGGTLRRFTPVAHAQCSACHRDAHQGALGPACSDCHASASWRATPGFDHGSTRFPLTGEHRGVGCDECHRAGGARLQFRGLPSASCSDCHRDPHQGRLGPGCAGCHATVGWKAVPAGRFDHGITAFPLEGAHATVRCESCHAPGAPLRIADSARCASCHADEHLGQLAHRDDGGACDSCHSVTGFRPPDFDQVDHATTRFPLAGEHRDVPCADCHAETSFRRVGVAGDVVRTAKLRYESRACAVCHADPHAGATDRWSDRLGCAACHGDAGWAVAVFDHSTTDFPLLGRHAETACGGCHSAGPAAGEERPLRLAGTPRDCALCHDEPHRGQFADRPGGCASCHTALDWRELLFDHDRDAAFRLEGAHARAPCGSCHLPAAEPGEAFVLYSPLPMTCEGCHGGFSAASW